MTFDWSEMLEDLLNLIQSNLDGNDRHTFGLVCRNWNRVRYPQSPCLVFPDRDSHIWKIFEHNSFYFLDFPTLDKNAAIRCSNHGWLLMSWHYSRLLFFDPFHNLKIEVPNCPDADKYTTMSFVHPPTSSECFIIGLVEGRKTVEIDILKHGENSWKTYKFTRRDDFSASLAHPILHDGKMYFLDARGNIATINMIDEPIVESARVHRKCLKHRRLRRDIKEHFLVKPDGENKIFAVFAIHNERKVKVFKLSNDFVWEPVDNLGDRVFYVSNFSSFGYTTHNKSMANKIFFHKFHGDKVVFYCLSTQQYHSFEGDYSSSCYDFTRFEHAAWMMHEPMPHLLEKLFTWSSQDKKDLSVPKH